MGPELAAGLAGSVRRMQGTDVDCDPGLLHPTWAEEVGDYRTLGEADLALAGLRAAPHQQIYGHSYLSFTLECRTALPVLYTWLAARGVPPSR